MLVTLEALTDCSSANSRSASAYGCEERASIPAASPIDLLRKGDFIEVRSGELVPADGRVVEGIGALNKAPLTGESVPVDINEGDFVQAGLVLSRGPVVLEVEAVGENTQLFELIETVHTYRDEPPRLQAAIERFTAIWVPVVIFGAFFVYWFYRGIRG